MSTSDPTTSKRKAEPDPPPANKKRVIVSPAEDDKDTAMEAVRTNGILLTCVSDRLRDDEEVVGAAVRQEPYALSYASMRLRGDLELVRLAVAVQPDQIRVVSKELLANRDAVLSLVQTNGGCFQHLIGWHDDFEITMAAINRNAGQVGFASSRLKRDRDVRLATASSRWFEENLKRSSENNSTVENREILIKLVRSKFAAIGSEKPFSFVTEVLKADRELNLLAAQRCGTILNYSKFNDDREIALAAVVRGASICFLTERLRGDREIALAAVSHGRGPEQLRYLPRELCGDREIVMAALQRYERREENYCVFYVGPPGWFNLVSEELRSDPEVVLEAVRRNGLFVRDCRLRPGDQDREVVEEAVEQCIGAFSFAPDLLRNHPLVVAVAVRKTKQCEDGRNHALGYVLDNIGASLIQKLNSIDDEYNLETNNSDHISLPEHKNVERWSTVWKQGLWNKIWALRAAKSSLPIEAINAIIGFTDILPDFRLSRKLSEVAPVIEALAEMDMEVNDLLNVKESTIDEENAPPQWNFL